MSPDGRILYVLGESASGQTELFSFDVVFAPHGSSADAIIAGRMALEPFNTTSYGIDIVSILYVDVAATPTEGWRDTFNMTPYDQVFVDAEGLGVEDEGVLAVTVEYDYTPIFVSIFTETIQMRETAIVRGRDTPYISKSS